MIDVLRSTLGEACPPSPHGPGDDAAVLPSGEVVTVDTLVEGVHFDDRLSAEDVGYKTLAVSVSDCAAMGARPDWALLSLSLPRSTPAGWVDDFARGLALAARAFGVRVVGGDTTGSPGPKVAAITLTGRPVGRPWLRSGARPGDRLWVTGWPGLAGKGWMDADPPASALGALRRPAPPLAFALAAAATDAITAAMDLSDGLASDLPKLAAQVAVVVDDDALPRHADLGDDALRYVYRGGDDYQILFAADAAAGAALHALAAEHGVRLWEIGAFEAGSGATRRSGAAWPAPGFDHFAEVA